MMLLKSKMLSTGIPIELYQEKDKSFSIKSKGQSYVKTINYTECLEIFNKLGGSNNDKRGN
jgi:hypothetical protein